MSIQGKKIAMARHAYSVMKAVVENVKTNFNNPLLMELGLVDIKAQAGFKTRQLQSIPAERFNDDGTLKPLDISAKSVVMVTDGVTIEEMENVLRKIGELL